MDWNKLSNAFEIIGISELEAANKIIDIYGIDNIRGKEIYNRKIIGGNICCHIAAAIKMALKE